MEKENKKDMPDMDQEESGVGPVIGSVIVVILVLIAGLYLVTSLKERDVIEDEPKIDTVEQENNNADTSDTSIETIEAELRSDGLSEIDGDVEAIEAEFDNQ